MCAATASPASLSPSLIPPVRHRPAIRSTGGGQRRSEVQQESSAPTERLLSRLEEGELDLVVAEVATDSPWRRDVAVLEPLSRRRAGGRVLALSPVARNGENRWIGLLEVEARDMAAGQ